MRDEQQRLDRRFGLDAPPDLAVLPMSGVRSLRIAQVAPPLERVPPAAYGGTERVVHALTVELVRRGHEVTVFASGDSDVPCRLVPTVERALWPAGFADDPSPYFLSTIGAVIAAAGEFDIVHSHLEWWSLTLQRMLSIPVVSTFHGRLDMPWTREALASRPSGLVAVSRSQASVHPGLDWTIVHNGLSLVDMPFASRRSEAFCFVGRVDPAKGILDAIEIAKLTGRPLRIAAKIGLAPEQRSYYEDVVRPALARAGRGVEFLGELGAGERNRLLAESHAALMPGAWPEPFGLVAIEALACGTPILARRVGALPEIIRDGLDGFFGDDATHLAFLAAGIDRLDRAAIGERVVERFSAVRMADRYEELYRRHVAANPRRALIAGPAQAGPRTGSGLSEARPGILSGGSHRSAPGTTPVGLVPVGPGSPAGQSTGPERVRPGRGSRRPSESAVAPDDVGR
jgi:glycosyltransferase involved in cell wall biosynthesis